MKKEQPKMLVVFPFIFVAHTKITFGYNFTTALKDLQNYNRNLFLCPPQK